MIVVLTGTNPYSFDRLLKPLDTLAQRNKWDVFVQLGNTEFKPLYCRYENFVERERLMELIKDADIVIAQGGYGGVRDALLYNKAIISVPRKPELGESTDYQEEFVRAMENKGYLIGVYNIADLDIAIEKANDFVPANREKSVIPGLVKEFLAGHHAEKI